MKGFILVAESSKEIEKELGVLKQIMEASSKKVELETVNVNAIMVISTSDFNGKIRVAGKEVKCPEFVFVGVMGVTKSYHIQAVLRMFESLGVLCINSAETMKKTNDKLLTFQIAVKEVPEMLIPKTVLVTEHSKANEIGEVLGYPVVLKVMHGSMGKGIMLAYTEKELMNTISMLFSADFDDEVIAQEAIMSSKGKDIRLIMAGGEVIHSFVRCNDGHFKSNVKQGGYLLDFEPPEILKDMSKKLAKALDLKIGSVDYLFGEKEDEFYLCEANSMPGITYIFEAKEKRNQKLLQKVMKLPDMLLKDCAEHEWNKKQ